MRIPTSNVFIAHLSVNLYVVLFLSVALKGNDEPITIRMENFLKELESAVGINAADVPWNSEMSMYSSDDADYGMLLSHHLMLALEEEQLLSEDLNAIPYFDIIKYQIYLVKSSNKPKKENDVVPM